MKEVGGLTLHEPWGTFLGGHDVGGTALVHGHVYAVFDVVRGEIVRWKGMNTHMKAEEYSFSPDVHAPTTTTFLPVWSIALSCCVECKIWPLNLFCIHMMH